MKLPSVAFLTVKADLLASIVVFLVALPLCMGIAVASGVPPAAGLVTGIVGGLLVGALAGCPLQVSGPAAGLTVIVAELVQQHGFEKLAAIGLMAGALQVLAALLQLGQWFRAVSPAVIQGMLAGIGFLILVGQFHVMIDDVPPGGGLENLVTIPSAIWKAVAPPEGSATAHQVAAGVGFLTILAIVLWNAFAPPKAKVLPALLVGVSLASGVAAWFQLPLNYVSVSDQMLTVIHFPSLDLLSHVLDTTMLSEAFALAFIASAETLLSATAVDHLHAGPRTKYNQELAAQGVGNMVCGLLGALPMTGVIVRSSANVEAGAKTRLSAILHGAWLLLLVSVLPSLLRMIPTASLAAVLVFTGYKLINPAALRELREYGKSEVVIYLVTLGTVVSANLLTGVLVGVGLEIAKLLYKTHDLTTSLTRDESGRQAALSLAGIATFLSLPRLATALDEVPSGARVVIEFDALRHIDHACVTLLQNWSRSHEAHGGTVELDWDKLKGVSEHA
jgi:MFS superfamily sulfate permease-like transporter